ncbi:cupin domain-containing protein [Phenylobacterium sp.]|jgi:quercetin dioxygenase-like cupin family protein|uniref:cupin domain-containing protein n=1 Tax=Phenylobacterium sp. TaxID=1871053 RepID=UPI002F410824
MSQEAVILHPADLPVKDRGAGIRTTPLVTARIGSTSLLNGVTKLAPGAAVPLHIHNCEESVLVVSGQARVHINGVERDVLPGDVTWIPTGVPHFFRNTSEAEPMAMFWTYASIDATRTILATGVTTRIDEEHAGAVPATA